MSTTDHSSPEGSFLAVSFRESKEQEQYEIEEERHGSHIAKNGIGLEYKHQVQPQVQPVSSPSATPASPPAQHRKPSTEPPLSAGDPGAENPPVANTVYIPPSVAADEVVMHVAAPTHCPRRVLSPTSKKVLLCTALGVILTSGLIAAYFCATGQCSRRSFSAFHTTPELKFAVEEYVNADNPENSDAAAQYGFPIGSWDVSRITDFSEMFNFEEAFNEDLNDWDVSSSTTMEWMFYKATTFNGNISLWNTARVTNMGHMFGGASSFNGEIALWDVGRVTTMTQMFHDASAFNGDITTWDVRQVKDAGYMFSGSRIDRNMCSWRLRLSVETNVGSMFRSTFCPSEIAPTLPDGPLCHDCVTVAFQDKQELYNAVDEYMGVSNPFLHSTAAVTYGYPMGLWDVSHITNFDFVFDPSRNSRMLNTFNEDLGLGMFQPQHPCLECSEMRVHSIGATQRSEDPFALELFLSS